MTLSQIPCQHPSHRNLPCFPRFRYPDLMCAIHTAYPSQKVAWGAAAILGPIYHAQVAALTGEPVSAFPETTAQAPGYCHTPAIDAILEGHIEGRGGRLTYFGGLSGDEANAILDELPDSSADGRQNNSPTFGQMSEFAELNPGVVLNGYRVCAERKDERITIDSLEVPGPLSEAQVAEWREKVDAWLNEVGVDGADEYDIDDDGVRLWWD